MLFMVLTLILCNFYHITAKMIIILALLNGLPLMAMASDNTWLDPCPVRWNMNEVLTLVSGPRHRRFPYAARQTVVEHGRRPSARPQWRPFASVLYYLR